MDKSYAVLRTYSHAHQADLALNKLKSEGVDAHLSDTNMGSLNYMGVAGGVKIHVAEEDIERAKEFLSSIKTDSNDG
ncbi:putative signal transducing protein [Fodinibius sp. SL11]|uniref:putative signal transducing protein n=1 Tax=Fodinibius sp. SL11 TaxID=3425690 RepID=UPI003F88291B